MKENYKLQPKASIFGVSFSCDVCIEDKKDGRRNKIDDFKQIRRKEQKSQKKFKEK